MRIGDPENQDGVTIGELPPSEPPSFADRVRRELRAFRDTIAERLRGSPPPWVHAPRPPVNPLDWGKERDDA